MRTPTRCAWWPTRSSPSASAPVKRAVLDPVAKRHHAPHPQALLLRGGDLIADLRVREIIDNGVDLGFDVHIEPMRQRYLAASILVPTSEPQNTCTLKPCALRGMVMPDAYHNCSYNSANPTSAGRTSATTTKSTTPVELPTVAWEAGACRARARSPVGPDSRASVRFPFRTSPRYGRYSAP